MRIRLRGPGHAGSLLAELDRCRRSGRYCDVFLRVGRRTFAAHRAVLACAGTYFRELFGRAPSALADAVSLEFVSPADFEKVLSFVYTGETLADLVDVGVLYELAERLGVSELARACHATFPDLPGCAWARGGAGGPGELAAASSVSSSAASRSSLSSYAAPAAGRLSPAGTACADLKIEDIQSLAGYGQILAESLWSGEGPPAGPELRNEKERTGEEAVPGAATLSREAGDAEPAESPAAALASGAEDFTASRGNEERRGQPAGEIIQLSDDDNFALEGDEEEDEEDRDRDDLEDDLVCVENGHGSQSGGQVPGGAPAREARAAPPPAEPAAPPRRAQSQPGPRHLCGAGVPRVGVRLFSCDMCHLDFCSQKKLLRHQRRSGSARYLAPLPRGREPRCAVCAQDLSKDFKAVREHVLSHVCTRSLSCGICRLPRRSLCSLLWHALAHLLLPVFSCPRCGRCFADRPPPDAHADIRVVTVGGGNLPGSEEPTGPAPPPSLALPRACPSFGGGGEAGGAPGRPGRRKARRPPDRRPSPSSPRELAAPAPFPADGGAGRDGAHPVRGKWYRCRYCGKRFAHSGEFTYHLRIHTGEKPYQCKVCLRFFRGRSTVICHLKTHAGALMYRCTVCGLYRSTLKTMALHVELHKDRLPPDFNMEHTFMYNDRSKEAPPLADA